jgi:hypothetical protein
LRAVAEFAIGDAAYINLEIEALHRGRAKCQGRATRHNRPAAAGPFRIVDHTCSPMNSYRPRPSQRRNFG